MKAYWHKAKQGPNFGDVLTPWLLEKHGIEHVWVRPRKARFFGAGSIAAVIPAGYTGIVWGTGKLKATQTIDLTAARVLAVRGPLTATADLYADPGLLAGLYAPDVAAKHPVGVISHYIDPLPHDGYRIDILSGVRNVIRAAAKCETIVTNSLHGLILADSLNRPNKWIYSPHVIGDGHKFRDYAASFDETIEPDVWRLAPQHLVAAKQEALLETIQLIEGEETNGRNRL